MVAVHHSGEPARVLEVAQLKDVVKHGIRERFEDLRLMGIKTVMVTGDNPLMARAIAQEAGSTTSSPRPRPRMRWPSSGGSRSVAS
ncbi:HAD family hydrolase [Streptomyces sp. NBC_01221]|uniref:HAD family hydrolase n=1 Tax=unclassified Streptomyces TaxID=2593676 RepID=UPI00338E2E5F